MEWLPILIPLIDKILARCFSQMSSEDPQEYLSEHYNASTGRMDSDVVRSAMASTRKAIRKAHREASKEERKTFPRYTRDEIYKITEDRLIEAMNAPKEQVSAVFSAAKDMTDDD